MTDPVADLDPVLLRLFAEAGAASAEDPDDTELAEHLVAALLGGHTQPDARIRAACVRAALRQRGDLRRRIAAMERRLTRVLVRAEDPAAAFERLRRSPAAEAGR